MPIHDLGYRAWDGRLCHAATRWWVIAQTGIRLAWKTRLLRRFVFLAWLPALYMGLAFFMWEQSATRPEMSRAAMSFFRDFAGGEGTELIAASGIDPAAARHQVWGWLLLTFFRHPQGILMALVVGLVAPPLISQDIRSRAFVLYFSRPITLAEYVLGKIVIVCLYVAAITTAPALGLYLFGVLLSPDLSVLSQTWDLPLRILASSVVLMIPTSALALALSSITTRSYYAGFAWFAIWAAGFISYYFLRVALADKFDERWSLLSLHHTLGRVQSWIFDLGVPAGEVVPALLLLTGVAVISLAIVFQRIAACTRT